MKQTKEKKADVQNGVKIYEFTPGFEETFAQCREVTNFYAYGRGAFMQIGQMLLRLAAPLM